MKGAARGIRAGLCAILNQDKASAGALGPLPIWGPVNPCLYDNTVLYHAMGLREAAGPDSEKILPQPKGFEEVFRAGRGLDVC